MNETCKYIGFPYDKILLRAIEVVALLIFAFLLYTTYIQYSGHAVTMENFPHFTHAREKWNGQETSYRR
jgi:hypothetical protein